ncbi:glycosyltransferase family 32 protein [Pseudoalteromonas sp. 2CM36K]|uniref:glycosyltransferase family 32 protein n=1 Tax=Pseudoalteromonas sp. 2CM36K TaxID=2929854 RepID=UPI0020BE941E|nr:glycosyltransferase [Pseudoalteromonas sp. 2CM36K]MCK8104712.1 hypothetical protein [Pseudoalteromonas sp. 2CM36K]
MTQIPKIVHYCWFGNNPKPTSVLKYIENWKSKLPEYEIIEWNESNFDIECCQYVQEAYKEKKFAFVSDYARLYALYHHGGIYLDTDVEVVKDLTPLLGKADCIFGFEEKNAIATSTILGRAGNSFIKKFMESYHSRTFLKVSGELDTTTNVKHLTNLLKHEGLQQNGIEQHFNFENSRILILPQQNLSPYDYINLIDNSTDETYTIHHYGNSWGEGESNFNKKLKLLLIKVFGPNTIKRIRGILG